MTKARQARLDGEFLSGIKVEFKPAEIGGALVATHVERQGRVPEGRLSTTFGKHEPEVLEGEGERAEDGGIIVPVSPFFFVCLLYSSVQPCRV